MEGLGGIESQRRLRVGVEEGIKGENRETSKAAIIVLLSNICCSVQNVFLLLFNLIFLSYFLFLV